ncbi:MAG: DUF1772 domain-containing protein [Chitinophagaceae bacterium]
MKFSTLALGISLFLSGLYGGTGFFTIMGGNPAVARLSERGFAEYWQQVDSFMGARMPVFGPILLLSLLTSVITLSAAWRSVSFWLVLLALVIIIGDIIFTLSTNHPLNQLIQKLGPAASAFECKRSAGESGVRVLVSFLFYDRFFWVRRVGLYS